MTRLREDGGFGNDSIREIQHAINLGPTLYKYDFAFDTPDLADGIEVYTPAVGDVLLDLTVQVTQSFDGTTPKADFGVDTSEGFLSEMFGGAYRFPLGPQDSLYAGILSPSAAQRSASSAVLGYAVEGGGKESAYPMTIGRFASTDPLVFWVSQDGNAGGAPIGGAAGAATLYLLIASPVSLNA